jgi:hypothetical protein
MPSGLLSSMYFVAQFARDGDGQHGARTRRALCLIEPATAPVHYWRCMRPAMRLRLWISMVATMGVLLHAGFLVRHGLAMADATLAYHAILTDLATLCRTGPGVERVPGSDLPSLPQPSDPAGCPVCAGLVGAFAIVGPQPAAVPVATAAATEFFSVNVAAVRPPRTAHPPARGPPAHA